MEAAFYRPLFGLLRFTADAYNRPNFGQLPCEPSMGFHAEIHCLHGFLRAEWVKTAHRATWPDAEHIPLRPIFTRFPA